MFVAAVLAALVVGFAGGLFACRVRTRWCTECGATTSALAARRRRPEAGRR